MRFLVVPALSCILMLACTPPGHSLDEEPVVMSRVINDTGTFDFVNAVGEHLVLRKTTNSKTHEKVWIFEGDTLRGDNNERPDDLFLQNGQAFETWCNPTIIKMIRAFLSVDTSDNFLTERDLIWRMNKGTLKREAVVCQMLHVDSSGACTITDARITPVQLDDDREPEYITEFDLGIYWRHIYRFYDSNGGRYFRFDDVELSNRNSDFDLETYPASTIVGLGEHGWGSGFGIKSIILYKKMKNKMRTVLPARCTQGMQSMCCCNVFGEYSPQQYMYGKISLKEDRSAVYMAYYTLETLFGDDAVVKMIDKKRIIQVFSWNEEEGIFQMKAGDAIPLSEYDGSVTLDAPLYKYFEKDIIKLRQTGNARQRIVAANYAPCEY